MSPVLSIVIPCYEDADALPGLLEALRPVLDRAGDAELVLVDDGSRDKTAWHARRLAESYPHAVTVVRLTRNFGQHPAVFAGLAHARGDVVVTMDSDLQYPADQVERLVERVSPEWPVVSGIRSERRDPALRGVITRLLTKWLNRQTKSRLRDFGSMFRAYDRAVVDQMLTVTERHRYVPAVVAWLGVPILELPVRHLPRPSRSRYRLGPLVDMLLDVVTGYSVSPLRIITGAGLAGCMVGVVATLAFLVYRLVEGSGGAGTVSAFAALFFLAGMQLLVVAMLAEYVGRIYTEVRGRPYYLVAEATHSGGSLS